MPSGDRVPGPGQRGRVYTVDGSLLGLPCGQTAASGTLFTIDVADSLGTTGTGTITVTSVLLRDCANVPIPAAAGAAALIPVDPTPPAAVTELAAAGPLTIHFLAAKQPGAHVENPRQVSAYEYPRVYGRCSPSFARATLQPSFAGAQLLIAGTASIVGHASEHVGAPRQQTLEILHNLNVLLARTEQLHGIDRGQWLGRALFKVYIRHPEHAVTIRDMLTALLPSHAQVLYLQGEMCRSELLVEIEAVLTQGQRTGVSQRGLADSSGSSATGRI